MTLSQPPEPAASSREIRWVLMICAGLAAAVFLVFSPTLRNGFVNFDDNIYVCTNPHVAKGFTKKGIIWAFTCCQPTGNWHPLTWLSHMLDCQIYGLNPAGHHFTNVLLHAATAILIFLFLNQTTRRLWPSAVVAGFFAIHPLRAESVAWVSERKDLFCGFFFMLTLLIYARYAQNKKISRPWRTDYGLTLLFFALGLMSKPMLVTLPFVLLLLDYWPLARITKENWQTGFRALLLEKIPLFLMAATVSAITFFAQSSSGALGSPPPALRVENALVSYNSYITKMFWPENLAALYPYPLKIPVWEAVGAGVLLLLVTGLVILRADRCRYLPVGWFWYLGMLVPVIGFVQAGEQAMADRFSYLPQIGLYLAIVWGVDDLATTARIKRSVLSVVTVLLMAILSVCCWYQTRFWHDSETLWKHTIACTPDNPMAEIDLGLAMESQGRWDEAINDYEKAVKIRPDQPYAYTKLGLALVRNHRLSQALDVYEKVVQIDPNNPGTQNDLAILLAGGVHYDQAADHFQRALAINPGFAAAHLGLGNVLARQNQIEPALEQFQAVLRIEPNNLQAHYNLAVLLASQARLDEAVEQFRAVIQLKPDDVNAHGNLANVLMGQSKLDEAIAEYQIAIQLDPKSDQAHYKLGLAYEKHAEPAAAIGQFHTTLLLNPNHQGAKIELAKLEKTDK